MGGKDPQKSIVRILRADGTPEGAGILVLDRYVVTCTHVVEPLINSLQDTVRIDFPLLMGNKTVNTRIERMFPVSEEATVGQLEDICVLKPSLDAVFPASVAPAVFCSSEMDSYGLEVKTCGFPAEMEEGDLGDWTEGKLKGMTGRGWVQMDPDLASRNVAPGFSGTAVWNKKNNLLVGMVVSVNIRDDVTSAYMIPSLNLMKSLKNIIYQSGVPPLLCYRINREKQIEKIMEMVNAECYELQCPKGVIISILHGDEYQCHSHFLECVEKHYWRKHIIRSSMDQPNPRRIQLDWPTWEAFEDVKTEAVWKLSNEFNIPDSEDFGIVSRTINHKTLDRAVLVHTRITSEDEYSQKIAHDFKTFWQEWPERCVKAPLLACLEVHYMEHIIPRKEIKWLNWFSFFKKTTPLVNQQKIRKTLKNQYVENLLPEMKNLTRSQVMKWAAEPDIRPNIQAVCDSIGMEFTEILRYIFEFNKDYLDENGRMPMEKLARLLAERFFNTMI